MVACLVATTAIMALHLPEGYWIIITIFIVSQANAGASIVKARERLAGTILGASAGILVTIAFPQAPWFSVPAFAFVVALGLFLGRTTTVPYASLLGSITVVLVIGGVEADPAGDIDRGLWRMLNISIGVLIGTWAQLFLWPEDPEEQLLDDFARTLADTDAQLGRLLEGTAAAAGATVRHLEQDAFSGLARHLDLLRHAEARYRGLRRRHSELLVAITAINRLATSSTSLTSFLATGDVNAPPPGSGLRRDVETMRAACERIRQAIACRQPLMEDPDGLAGTGFLARISPDFEAGPTILRPILLDIRRALEQLPPALSFLGTTAAEAAATPELRSPLDTGAPDPIFTPRCSLSNTDDLRFAAKGTMATMFCYLLTNALHWTSGLTAVVSCPIIAQSSVGATFQKAILRLSGSILGGILALAAMLYAIPNTSTLPGLLLVVTVCAACSGYITAGSARINYAGVQMGIAFALGLLDTPAPSPDVLVPMGRVLGIVVGDIVSATIFYYTWPVFAGAQMRLRLATALRHMADLSRLGLPDLAGGTLVRPARGFRLQIFQDVSTVLQLYNEAEFEPRSRAPEDRARRERVLAVLQTAQSIALTIIAIVRHRVNARFTEADPEARVRLRAFALAIAPTLQAAADRLEGRPAAAVPDLDPLLADAAAAVDTGAGGAGQDAAARTAMARLRDQVQFYRTVAPMLHDLDRLTRSIESPPEPHRVLVTATSGGLERA